jgi:hypothetical protein
MIIYIVLLLIVQGKSNWLQLNIIILREIRFNKWLNYKLISEFDRLDKLTASQLFGKAILINYL